MAWCFCGRQKVRQAKIIYLQAIKAKTRFLSIEPLLEDIGRIRLAEIHWVIVGGESGSRARPMEEKWALSVRDQCHSAGVDFSLSNGEHGGPTAREGPKVQMAESFKERHGI